jgi:soluble lytic murein transglycosylase
MQSKQRSRIIAVAVILIGSIALSLLLTLGLGLIGKILHPTEYKQYVEKYAKEYNVPEYVIFAVINVESGFDPKAISSVGALGLMQMLPTTFTWLSSFEHLGENLPVDDLYDPEVSIRYGTYYLKYLFEKFYNWDTVFAAYNGGEGNVAKWLGDSRYSDGKGGLKNIPFPETEKYVEKINDNIEYYKDTYYN